MYSIILCGGSGTRLWPLSRKNFPKQFLKLYSDKSLLQETFLRMKKIMPTENIFFITNQNNFFNTLNQIKDLDSNFNEEQILVEPNSLNTAPAITFAIKHLVEKVKISLNAPIAILPSDHYIKNEKKYFIVMQYAMNNIGDHIGTIGITPTGAKTGYGYIKKGARINHFHQVSAFKEKPSKEIARQYIASKEYLWNSGKYIFTARTFFNELKKHAPEIYLQLTTSYDEFLKNFNKMPDISIDFAISEKSNNIIVIEGDFGWNDIGSFDSLAEINKEKENEKCIKIDSKNIFLHSTSNKLITTVGIDDVNIIETNDSILVQKKQRGEDVKKIVEILKEKNFKELQDSQICYRPWGSYEILIDTPTYKVKKIIVYPGSKLSLQAHYHRAEHWIVVKGLAKVTNGDKEIYLKENESTFIAPLSKHRLENPGKINVEMIEVQTGNYMEEDDIIRFEDIYNRIKK
jgi:mannose-1-phosphate guanylyltransferase/mannose-6-phosphate isomerase